MHIFRFIVASLLFFTCFSVSAADENAQEKISEKLKDSQILNILVNLNNSEIQGGQLARHKVSDKEIKAFVEQMLDDHSQMNKDIQKLSKTIKIRAESSDLSESLKKENKEKMQVLEKDKGPAFDNDYLKYQIINHQDALKLFDEKLIPFAKNEILLKNLKQARETVQRHLDAATKLQSFIKR